MKKGGALALTLIALSLGVHGCSGTGEDKKQAAKVAERPPVAVEVARITSENITDGIDVVGSLSSKFGADVKSEYTGIVTEVFVTEWVKVKKGDPLARLDTREIDVVLQKAKAAVEVAKANLLQAEVATNRVDREYERASKLKEFGLITQQNLDDAEPSNRRPTPGLPPRKPSSKSPKKMCGRLRPGFPRRSFILPWTVSYPCATSTWGILSERWEPNRCSALWITGSWS